MFTLLKFGRWGNICHTCRSWKVPKWFVLLKIFGESEKWWICGLELSEISQKEDKPIGTRHIPFTSVDYQGKEKWQNFDGSTQTRISAALKPDPIPITMQEDSLCWSASAPSLAGWAEALRKLRCHHKLNSETWIRGGGGGRPRNESIRQGWNLITTFLLQIMQPIDGSCKYHLNFLRTIRRANWKAGILSPNHWK